MYYLKKAVIYSHVLLTYTFTLYSQNSSYDGKMSTNDINKTSFAVVKHTESIMPKKETKKHYIPISKKNILINKLERENTDKREFILKLSIFTIALFILLIFIVFESQKMSSKMNQIISTLYEIESKNKYVKYKTPKNDLSENTINSIMNKLNEFEKSNKYLNNDYTLNSLAKELNTNSAYLSKTINSSMNVNFSNYINSLRVEYSIKKLKEDKIFREYTIKAISKEVGFNSSQSFSKAFIKSTGLYPSEYIKSINSEYTL